MAKLTANKGKTEVPVAGVANSVPSPMTVAPQTTAAVPFTIQTPGDTGGAPGAKPNLTQKRTERRNEALANGTPFTFVRTEVGEFQCICGSTGKNAIVLHDRNGAEVKVGGKCLEYTGVTLPKTERAATGPSAPGISKQQKFSDALSKYQGPFVYVRKQDGAFQCFCGGRGTHQIVVRDVNGTEFSVGNTCAKLIPGVDVPAPPKVVKVAAPVIAGLKGSTQAPPTFENIS